MTMTMLMTTLAINLVILLLPANVYSTITINVTPGKTISDTKFEFNGQDVIDFSWEKRKPFSIWDRNLKDASKKYTGRRCDDIYSTNPTYWGDVFGRYGWECAKRYLTPVSGRVISSHSRPVAVNTAEFVNSHDTLPSVYTSSLSHSVEQTTSHSWTKEKEFTIGQDVSYNFFFAGTTSVSYTSRWGEAHSNSTTVSIGSTSSIQTTVPPKAKILAKIIASKNIMVVEITYKVTFGGCVFCHFRGRYKGHYFYCYAINDLLNAEKIPTEYTITERINMGFYSDARLEITNAN